MRFALVLLIAFPALAADEPPSVRCEGGWCIMPELVFMQLAQGAARTQHYAKLCGWEK